MSLRSCYENARSLQLFCRRGTDRDRYDDRCGGRIALQALYLL